MSVAVAPVSSFVLKRPSKSDLLYELRNKPVPGLPPMSPVLEGLGIDVIDEDIISTYRPKTITPRSNSPTSATSSSRRRQSSRISNSSPPPPFQADDVFAVERRPSASSSRHSTAINHPPLQDRLSSSSAGSDNSGQYRSTKQIATRPPPPPLPIKSSERQVTPPRTRRSSFPIVEVIRPTPPAAPRSNISNPSIARIRESAANQRQRRSLPEAVSIRRGTMVDLELLRAAAGKPLPQAGPRPTQNISTQTPADWDSISPGLTTPKHWIDVRRATAYGGVPTGRNGPNFVAPSPSVYSVHSMAVAQDSFLRARKRDGSRAGSLYHRNGAESTYDDDGYQDEELSDAYAQTQWRSLPPNLAPATTPRAVVKPPSPPASYQGYDDEEVDETDLEAFPSTPDFNKLLALSLELDTPPVEDELGSPFQPITSRRESIQIPARRVSSASQASQISGRRASQPNLSVSYGDYKLPLSDEKRNSKRISKSIITEGIPTLGPDPLLPKLQARRLLSDAFSLGPADGRMGSGRRPSLPAQTLERSHRELTRAEKGRSFFLVQALHNKENGSDIGEHESGAEEETASESGDDDSVFEVC